MMFDRTIIWIDDEPALMDAELFDLENHHFGYEAFQWVGDALVWMNENRGNLKDIRGLVIDVQLPSRGDPRFVSDEGVPVGVKFCERLKEDAGLWQEVKSKIVLYTRLPQTSAAAVFARSFASSNEVRFYSKNAASRVAIELIREKILESET